MANTEIHYLQGALLSNNSNKNSKNEATSG